MNLALNGLLHRTGAFVQEIAYLPLAEDIPIAFNSCRKGPRSLGWRDDRPAELTWIECQVRLFEGRATCLQLGSSFGLRDCFALLLLKYLAGYLGSGC